MEYDVIGDVHGQAVKLRALLREVGYREKAGRWAAPAGRQAVFVGDLIDRGPEQRNTVDLVRRMVDAGDAHCVMGNHEFNAIAYATRRQGAAEYLREHSAKNLRQHGAFLREVGEGSRLHAEYVQWFRTLPVAMDLGAIRVVHAWWNEGFANEVNAALAGRPMDDAFLHEACTKGTRTYRAMDGLTKGCEIALPEGHSFRDHDGVQRREVRVRWWNAAATTYRSYAAMGISKQASVPELPIAPGHRMTEPQGSPIFVGHYWFDWPQALDSSRVACVDYSAAGYGPLVCYRWQGEERLTPSHFLAVGGSPAP